MRVVLQRVSSASVAVDQEVIAAIQGGMVLLTGFGSGDDASVLAPMADKICGLRIFEDENGRFQHSLNDIRGELLAVPQFTLYGDATRGRRPDFTGALAPESAETLFNEFVALLRERAAGNVASGRFGARMAVHLVNDGPVTLMLERSAG
ncbi:MAG: D-aminoacyl-tRNA deacylase [Arenicellales bacterium]|jgi:D-tyrosyl-tRNA(Tyr) deacylase